MAVSESDYMRQMREDYERLESRRAAVRKTYAATRSRCYQADSRTGFVAGWIASPRPGLYLVNAKGFKNIRTTETASMLRAAVYQTHAGAARALSNFLGKDWKGGEVFEINDKGERVCAP